MNYKNPFGATPLNVDELGDLIPSHIQTMEELNAFEHVNILLAEKSALRGRFALSIRYAKSLHKKMFNNTWLWAGVFRKTEKNIGIEAYKIQTELSVLFQDILFQIEHKSYGFDEIAARFHHRLVFIHAFPNGNGRHARLMTDLLLLRNGQSRFSWGRGGARHPDDEIRKRYIAALRKADKHDISDLLDFVRS